MTSRITATLTSTLIGAGANDSALTVNESGVPESVGMPLVGGSPIVESGSNANGSYIKFADGTLLMYGSTLTGAPGVNSVPITFPVDHATAGGHVITATCEIDPQSDPGGWAFAVAYGTWAAGGVTLRVKSAGDLGLFWSFIGRWK